VVTQVLVAPVHGSALADYQVVVRNDGRSVAASFGVVLSVDGAAQPPLTASSLDPGARTTLNMQAPRCAAGSTVEVVLDPAHQISEALGGGESDTLPCPLRESGTATPATS
jgi:subtilase family serine protease